MRNSWQRSTDNPHDSLLWRIRIPTRSSVCRRCYYALAPPPGAAVLRCARGSAFTRPSCRRETAAGCGARVLVGRPWTKYRCLCPPPPPLGPSGQRGPQSILLHILYIAVNIASLANKTVSSPSTTTTTSQKPRGPCLTLNPPLSPHFPLCQLVLRFRSRACTHVQ